MEPCRLLLLGTGQDRVDDHIFGEVSRELHVRIKSEYTKVSTWEKGLHRDAVDASHRLSVRRLDVHRIQQEVEGAESEEDKVAVACDSCFAFPSFSNSKGREESE